MPKRRRSSVGAVKKYRRKRHQCAESSDDFDSDCDLNQAFCIETPSLAILDEAFYEEPPVLREEIGVQCEKQKVTTEEIGIQCEELKVSKEDVAIQCEEPKVSNEEIGIQCNSELDSSNCAYDILRKELKNIPEPWILNPHSDQIEILSVASYSEKTYVRLRVCICISGGVTIFVHNKNINDNHPIWNCAPKTASTKDEVLKLMTVLSNFNVCIGNPEEELVSLIPVGAGISLAPENEIIAYREGNFNAFLGDVQYSSTIRASKCDLIVEDRRCHACRRYRKALKQRQERQKRLLEKEVDLTKSTFKHRDMPREILIKKIEQQKVQISDLQSRIGKLERQLKNKILTEGVKLNSEQDRELRDLMASCDQEVSKAYPDSNSFQRLFWSQQLKCVDGSKYGMRWHPMIIRWCLAIRQKSQAAYDTLRDTGFVTLPSNRTLFDYSHYIKSNLGFNADVIEMLESEANKLDMFKEEWRKYVGLLFDEIKIKEDLVYDKVSGELIGYLNLDSVGNSILDLENILAGRENSVAKYVLVLMVRGVTAPLKFPFAAFATQSITADFLYPLIWTAISILEGHLDLRVLFLTCDGASSNRKFFNMHRLPGFDSVNYVVNPYDSDRNIYFISDVPHLIKTTRNCFSNSFSHKQSRRLWCNGKDISWMHIVRLFQDHCEFNMYTPCPKLTRSHIDLNAFTYMKVNLAAQVLSDSVAYALEDLYGEEVSETITFIRNMNKFFDIMNVRSIHEGRNKRNPNLNPFTSSTDERLTWLNEEFLQYFDSWKESVMLRQGQFSKTETAGMMLSYQTLNGIAMSVKSIVSCVKFVLDMGAKFVLTTSFNQDPLEQHFSHYRHKGGHNRNPTVNDVRHLLTSIRTIGAQGLKPVRNGNTEVQEETHVIDNSKLPRRR